MLALERGVPLFNAPVRVNPIFGMGKFGLIKLETFLYRMVQSIFQYLELFRRDARV